LPTPTPYWALLTVPFILLLVVGLLRTLFGPHNGLLPLLVIGPASAAAVGGPVYTLAVGGVAVGQGALMAAILDHTPPRTLAVLFTSIAGVTIGGAAASHIRRRRERELIDVQAVADVTQRVLLRPVPASVGPLRLAARYLSASTRARVGGDLYGAVLTGHCVRLIVGDAEGKGLPAVHEAATAMATFRSAAQQELTLAGVAARIEGALDYELDDEQFVTAVLAEVSPDGSKIEMINCGHPQPLQIGPRGVQLLGPAQGGPPLGLGLPEAVERVPFTISLEPGEQVLFYTDGLSEARNAAGEFFPLTDCASLQVSADLSDRLGRLIDEVYQYVGHKPHDDVALLLVERTAP
jgi:serine phosphatase RsbU (regulator of sigma subunit)